MAMRRDAYSFFSIFSISDMIAAARMPNAQYLAFMINSYSKVCGYQRGTDRDANAL